MQKMVCIITHKKPTVSNRDCNPGIPNPRTEHPPIPGFWDGKTGLGQKIHHKASESIIIICPFAQYYLQQHAWQIKYVEPTSIFQLFFIRDLLRNPVLATIGLLYAKYRIIAANPIFSARSRNTSGFLGLQNP